MSKKSKQIFICLVWITGIIFAVHELSEWNMKEWYDTYYVGQFALSNAMTRIALITMSLVYLVIAGVINTFQDTRIHKWLLLLYAFIPVGNGIQHICWSIMHHAICPGFFGSVAGIAVFVFNLVMIVKMLSFTKKKVYLIGVLLIAYITFRGVQTFQYKDIIAETPKRTHQIITQFFELIEK